MRREVSKEGCPTLPLLLTYLRFFLIYSLLSPDHPRSLPHCPLFAPPYSPARPPATPEVRCMAAEGGARPTNGKRKRTEKHTKPSAEIGNDMPAPSTHKVALCIFGTIARSITTHSCDVDCPHILARLARRRDSLASATRNRLSAMSALKQFSAPVPSPDSPSPFRQK